MLTFGIIILIVALVSFALGYAFKTEQYEHATIAAAADLQSSVDFDEIQLRIDAWTNHEVAPMQRPLVINGEDVSVLTPHGLHLVQQQADARFDDHTCGAFKASRRPDVDTHFDNLAKMGLIESTQ